MAVSEKENYRSEMKRRLESLERTMNELKSKAARRRGGDPGFDKHIAEFEVQKKAIEERLRIPDHSDRDRWQQFQDDMERFFSDMDENMRSALRFYK